MKTKEGKLKDEIKAYLEARKLYYFMPVQTGYGKTAVDFLICFYGRFVACETKKIGDVPTPRQNLCLQEVKESEGISFWCDSFESFKMSLKAYELIRD